MSKQHKLVDTQTDCDFQRVADVAREVQVETELHNLANALEIARLQTEVADLREENTNLLRGIHYYGPKCPECEGELLPVRTICKCSVCNAEVHVDVHCVVEVNHRDREVL